MLLAPRFLVGINRLMAFRPLFHLHRIGVLVGAATVLAIALQPGPGRAQGAPVLGDGQSVFVDLSVIDGGPGPAPSYAAPSYAPGAFVGQGRPMMPGSHPPVSRFFGPGGPGSPTAAALEPPKAEAKPKVRAAQAPKPVAAPKPKAQPKAVAEAKPKPAPAPKRAPTAKVETVMAPKPPPSEPPPMAQTSIAPPASPPEAKAPPPPPPAAVPMVAAPIPPKAKEEPKSQAALPPSGAPAAGDVALRIAFPNDDSKLPANSQKGLKELAAKMKADEGLRLQLLAYAGGGDLSSSKARRLSLSRALAVRSYLIEDGVRATRIDVRALGDKTAEQPMNRVDVNLVAR